MDTSCQRNHVLLGALLACAVVSAGAQPAVPQGNYYDYTAGGQQQEMRVSTTMIALLAAAVAVFLLIALATIYLRHCTGHSHDVGWSADLSAGTLPANTFVSRRHRRASTRGLAAGVIETFPTMRYAEAKAMRVGKVDAALECAVCLSEFEDEEKLRFLPKCSHAFHPECIGEWLASHVTCPVCRCNLDPSKDTSSDELVLPAPQANSVSSEVSVLRHDDSAAQSRDLVIDVVTAEEEEEERMREAMDLQRIGTQRRAMRSPSGRRPVVARLVRSHSTGHSHAVRLDHDLERFTLRLPEHVRMAMVASGELMSSRRRKRRSFFSYTGPLSVRLPSFFSTSRTGDSSDGGEVSSSSSWAMFKGKRVTAVNGAAESSARGVVRLDRIGGSVSGAKAGAVAVDVEKGG